MGNRRIKAGDILNGTWYGQDTKFEAYRYKKKDDKENILGWDDHLRVKPISDYRKDGGFELEWALSHGVVWID